MKKIIAVAILLGNIMMSNAALAENSWLKITDSYFSVDWVSKYVYSSGFVAGKGSAFQPAGGITINGWLKPSFWGSVPSDPGRFNKDSVSELDTNLDAVFGRTRFGVAYYWMQRFEDTSNDAFQVSFQVSGDEIRRLQEKFLINYTLRVESNFPSDGKIKPETVGTYLFAIVNLSYKFSDKLTFNLGIKNVGDLGGYGADPAGLMVLTPSVTCKFAEKRTINIGLDIHKVVIQSPSDLRHDEYVLRVGMPF